MVEADRRRPPCERIAEQETAATPDVEELVAGAEGEILEDRHPGEVVDVLGTVDGDRARAGRAAGDAAISQSSCCESGSPVATQASRSSSANPNSARSAATVAVRSGVIV